MSEREEIIALLALVQVMAVIDASVLSPELKQELSLAIEDDTMSDEALFDLAKRVNACLPDLGQGDLDFLQASSDANPKSEPPIDASKFDAPTLDFPSLLLTLLSDDWVFFQKNEIVWNGGSHEVRGIQVNAAKADGFMDFVGRYASDFDDIQDVVAHLIGFLGEVEKDEGLRVPREKVHPGVRKALFDGPLTGMTLAALFACGMAISVKQTGPATYAVLYDTRLAVGIPCFFDLVGRLMWDLRQGLRSLQGRPFRIAFLSARSFDADRYLGIVDEPVAGAQECPQVLEVRERPQIDLDGLSKSSRSFLANDICIDIGASSATDPLDIDFECYLRSLVRDFPVVLPIEGTHHHGRAARIENVKVGDELVLKSDWENDFFSPVAIEVFNSDDETLGYLSYQDMFDGYGHQGLACLLPLVRARVASVTPLSKRRRNAKYALMDVEMRLSGELLDIDARDESASALARTLLSKSPAQRACVSLRTASTTKNDRGPSRCIEAEAAPGEKACSGPEGDRVFSEFYTLQQSPVERNTAAEKAFAKEREEIEGSLADLYQRLEKINKKLSAGRRTLHRYQDDERAEKSGIKVCTKFVNEQDEDIADMKRRIESLGIFSFRERSDLESQIKTVERFRALDVEALEQHEKKLVRVTEKIVNQEGEIALLEEELSRVEDEILQLEIRLEELEQNRPQGMGR